MAATAVVLLSGSLDSLLAARLLQDQGLRLVGFCHDAFCQPRAELAASAARALGVPLVVHEQGEAYTDLLRHPAHGVGRGMNPCLDCRIHVFRLARKYMEEIGAELAASGEVLGQHPMTQKRRDLELVAEASGLRDRLLRPLSARRLVPTMPERSGIIMRENLLALSGRGRRAQTELASQWGLADFPTALPGCALAEAAWASRVGDLLARAPSPQAWDFALLRVGHHLRLTDQTLLVVGRNAHENACLEQLFRSMAGRTAALVIPDNFAGPSALLVGPPGAAHIGEAQRSILHRSKSPPAEPRWRVDEQP